MGRSRSYYPTIPLKPVTPRMKVKQLSHLRHVLFRVVEREKVSILIGTSLQEAFIPLEVHKGKSNEPLTLQYDPASAGVSLVVPLVLVVNATST